MTDRTNETIQRMAGGGRNGAEPVDIGTGDAVSDSISRTAALASSGLREAFAESAKRAVEMAKANLQRAQEDVVTAERFADTVRQYSDRMCADLEAGFARAQAMSENVSRTLAIIAAKTAD